MVDNELVARVEAKIMEVQDKLAAKGWQGFGINYGIQVLKGGQAGIARVRQKTIVISGPYLKAHPEEVINVTVPHEICHLYVHHHFPNAKQHHGKEFRYFMNLLGLRGDTYHSLGLVEGQPKRKFTKFEYQCSCGTKFYIMPKMHQSIQRGRHRHCVKCKTDIEFTGHVAKV